MRAKSMKTLFLLVLSWLCVFPTSSVFADTRSQKILEQTPGMVLTKSVGGVMARVKRQRDLPNAFGGSDIFGGKIAEGFTELRFQGRTPQKNPKFKIVDERKESTETTMSRYGNKGNQVNVNVNS